MTSRRRYHVGRRRAVFVVIAAAAIPIAACDALTGAHDRLLDDADAAGPNRPRADASDGASSTDAEPGDSDVVVDAGPDVVFIDVPLTFSTPNGAVFSTTAGGTTITAAGGASHPVIVPMPPPGITAEDYTVYATVLAPGNGEFGVLTRFQPDGGAAVCFGSKFGTENRSFMGSFKAPDWNPALDTLGPTYVYTPNERFKFRLRAVGNEIAGKLWDAKQPEPASFQVLVVAPWTTGRGIGFYTYTPSGAVLESLRISIP